MISRRHCTRQHSRPTLTLALARKRESSRQSSSTTMTKMNLMNSSRRRSTRKLVQCSSVKKSERRRKFRHRAAALEDKSKQKIQQQRQQLRRRHQSHHRRSDIIINIIVNCVQAIRKGAIRSIRWMWDFHINCDRLSCERTSTTTMRSRRICCDFKYLQFRHLVTGSNSLRICRISSPLLPLSPTLNDTTSSYE